VADNLAPLVDQVFADTSPGGFAVMCGVYGFALQIYCDFSGYSDVARGCAKCMGMELMLNFNHPYIAVSPSDFWRRWHISLSTWLRDYLYIPLGGNRHGPKATQRNLMLTMLLGGLWHGAEWKFVVWGAYHGLLLIVFRLVGFRSDDNPQQVGTVRPWGRRIVGVFVMFHLTCLGWMIFRGQSVGQIGSMLQALFATWSPINTGLAVTLLSFGLPLIVIETIQLIGGTDMLHRLPIVPSWMKCMGYAVLFYLVAFYGASAQSFIYFQF
jgi:alginate O-acetyltransferase complex protein AlgI